MKHFFLFSIIILTLNGCSSDSQSKKNPIAHSEKEEYETKEAKPSQPSFLDQEEETNDYTSKYTVVPPEDQSIITLTEFTATKPASWIWTPPRSTFSSANYILPAVQSSEPALLAITEFDVDEGGNIDDNVARWNSQFRDFEGAPVKPVIKNISFQGINATEVAFRGEYMGAGAAWHKPDHTMIIIVLEQPTKRAFFKILGPTETVNVHRDPLYEMLHSIELLSD